jgi:hypothetical protein
MVRVLIFTVITVIEMDMWRHSTTGRRKLRLTVLHGYWWYLFWRI